MALIGDLKPYFGEISRLLRSIANALCRQITPIQQTTSAGTGSIPAGFKSVAIAKTSSNADTVTLTLSDGSVYTMTELGEIFVDSASVSSFLPAYTKGGAGTIKWHGVN